MTTSVLATEHASPALPLIDSRHHYPGWRGLRGRVFAELMGWTLGVVKAGDDYGLPESLDFPPYADSRRYGITHYGIMISDLPAPHHFLACASILGASGMRVFDIDFAVDPEDGPRHTSTLVHGTAAAVDGHFTRYSIPKDMQLNDDGSLLRFGENLEISGHYPDYRLQSQRPDFSVDLELTATGEITWFAKSAAYEHLSLLTRYRGTLTCKGETLEVSGLCSYEYARGVSPCVLSNKSLPPALKLPWDTFSYQVINLDADTQLLFAFCRADGHPLLTSAYIREAGCGARRIDGDVHFKVLSLQASPGIAPGGRETALPETFLWAVRDHEGQSLFEIRATVDTPMLFGLGQGFVGGYRWEGSRNGEAARGRGYIEYVDQRNF